MSAEPSDFGARWADELRHAQRDEGARRDDDSWVDSDNNPDRPTVIEWSLLEGRDPPPRFWHLAEWLGDAPAGFFGAGGKGKSLIAQATATALAVGLEYFTAAPATPVRVLYWSCEDDHDEIWRRPTAINWHLRISMSDLAGKLYVDVRLGIENTVFTTAYGKPCFTELRKELAEQIGDYRTSIVILDNIAQVFGGNASDPHHVTEFVNGIQGLGAGKVQHFAPLFLGHVARAQGSEFMGSAAWENACRMRWYMGETLPDQAPYADDERDPDVIYLAKRKANYSNKDFTKLTFRNGLFVPAGMVGEFDPGSEGLEQIVLRAFDKVIEVGIHPTDGRTSPDYLPKVLKRLNLCPSFTVRDLAGAMSRLMGQGRLRRAQVGHYGNRAPRFGLVKV